MRRLRAESPGTRVIQIASRNDQDLGMLALLAGSAGFLVKDMDLARLPAVIRGVDSNEAAVSRSFAALLVERLRSLPEAAFTRA
jgi:DNA-binding NarL/FixJ family response regulator